MPISTKGVTADDIGNLVVIENVNHEPSVQGMLRYVGPLEGQQGIYCGVELSDPYGKNDGSYKGVHLFECQPLHGLFVSVNRVHAVIDSGCSTPQECLTPVKQRMSHLNDPLKTNTDNIMFESNATYTVMFESNATYNVPHPMYLLDEIETPKPLISAQMDDMEDDDVTTPLGEHPGFPDHVTSPGPSAPNDMVVDDPTIAQDNRDNKNDPAPAITVTTSPKNQASVKPETKRRTSLMSSNGKENKENVNKRAPISQRASIESKPPPPPQPPRPKKVSKHQQIMEQILKNKDKEPPKKPPPRSRISDAWSTSKPEPKPVCNKSKMPDVPKAKPDHPPKPKPIAPPRNAAPPAPVIPKSRLLDEMNVKLKNMEKSHKAEIHSLVEQHKKELEEVKTTLDSQRKDEIKTLEDKQAAEIDAKNKEIAEAEATIGAQKEDIEQREKKTDVLEAEIAQLNEKCSQLENKKVELIQEVTELRGMSPEGYDHKLELLKLEVKSLNEVVQLKGQENADLQKDKNRYELLKDQYHELQRDLMKMQREYDHAQYNIKCQTDVNKSLREECTKKANTIEALEEKILTLEKKESVCLQRIDELENTKGGSTSSSNGSAMHTSMTESKIDVNDNLENKSKSNRSSLLVTYQEVGRKNLLNESLHQDLIKAPEGTYIGGIEDDITKATSEDGSESNPDVF